MKQNYDDNQELKEIQEQFNIIVNNYKDTSVTVTYYNAIRMCDDEGYFIFN